MRDRQDDDGNPRLEYVDKGKQREEMPENSGHHSGKKSGDLVISIPEHVRKGLPDTLSLDDIGRIDLREAESIADEGLLFLKEHDLIEGLDDFDLIPLKKEHAPAEDVKAEGIPAKIRERREEKEPVSEVPSEIPPEEGKGETTAVEKEDAAESPSAAMEPVHEERGEDRDWVPIEQLDWIDEKGGKWLPLERIGPEMKKIHTGPVDEGGKAAPPLPPVATSKGEKSADAGATPSRGEVAHGAADKPRIIEGFVESDDEYVIWDMPEGERTEGVSIQSGEAKTETPLEEVPTPHKEPVTREGPIAAGEAGDVKAAEEPVLPPEKGTIEEAEPEQGITGVFSPVETTVVTVPTAVEKDGGRIDEGQGLVPEMPPEGVPFDDDEEPRVHFIDDRELTSRIEEKEERPGIDLERVTRGIVQFEEAPGYILRESDQRSDRELIAHIAKDLEPDFEELFVDLDYIYRDEEIDYIHAAIVEEDYSDYIREIDEFSGTRGGGVVPAAVELLGLTADEFDTIEDLLFSDELRDVNLYDRYHLYEFGGTERTGGRSEKQCRYMLPTEDSLVDIERDSIESDVSSGSALIFEEDVSRISEELKIKTGRTDVDAVEIVESVISPEIVAAVSGEPEPRETEAREAVEPVLPLSAKMPDDDIDDITDRVIILDDEEDVDRFIRGLPEQKQVDMKTLLSYLDGLFEKLPERVIKRFASSEYFDLYLKVLNELGV